MPGKADHENRTTKTSPYSRNRPDKVESTLLSLDTVPCGTSHLLLLQLDFLTSDTFFRKEEQRLVFALLISIFSDLGIANI